MAQKQRNREEVVNTQLAILISGLGVTADAETIHVHGKHRPDVLFQLRGLRVVIEGKFADHPNAEHVALEDARKRVRSGIAHIAAAAIYPLPLRTTRTPEILEALWGCGLNTLAACGDVTRNITGCQVAGVDRNEVCDASPLALVVASSPAIRWRPHEA